MLFNSALFGIFLITALSLWHSISLDARLLRQKSAQNKSKYRTIKLLYLLVISLLFYSFWNINYLLLIIWIAFVDFVLAWGIHGSKSKQIRLLLLLVSLANSLGLLLFFKYGHFIAENWATIAGSTQSPDAFWSQWLLPVGISFYTFQSISYVVDVYQGELVPERKFSSYLLFLSFFPQLVAGPIVTAKSFLPQIRRPLHFLKIPFLFGTFLILLGLFKKMVLADHLAEVADIVFSHPGSMSSRALWMGMFSYSLQIYCDFSGYTDIAQGTAVLFGFHLPENFRMPYLSSGFSEFWTRWHISLSQWLKKYLYIPLGGNRMGVFLTYRNLILVMAIGGLWHGASWNFVVWGIGHGIFLVMERWVGIRYSLKALPALKPFKVLFTFFSVTLLWVFFRSANLGDSLCYLQGIFTKKEGFLLPYTLEMKFGYCFVLVLIGHLIGNRVFKENKQLLAIFEKMQNSLGKLAFLAFIAVLSLIMIVLYSAESKPFVYFVF
ncbi:MBOAT family O-acyltransferase [Leptospira limi]|uniref:MBOAT family protein n=1 Tax=Leptospira limi TaxID=2950023 RepID=A0ABT3M1I5_9LEPT|nr:MBOAT family O-acyltransferase [Leptospira limi]MCW7463843.1 MBOAT family protein [Leptospira limi]